MTKMLPAISTQAVATIAGGWAQHPYIVGWLLTLALTVPFIAPIIQAWRKP